MSVRFLGLLVIIALAFVVYFTTSTLSQVQQLSIENKTLNERTSMSAARLIDCTTPGHACYDQGNAKTAAAIDILNQATEAAVVCGDRPGTMTYGQMKACVQAQMKNHH